MCVTEKTAESFFSLFSEKAHIFTSLSFNNKKRSLSKAIPMKEMSGGKSTSCQFVQKCTFSCSKQAAIFQNYGVFSAKSLFPRKMQWHHQGASVWIGGTITVTFVHVALKPFAVHDDQSQFFLSSCVISVGMAYTVSCCVATGATCFAAMP